MNTIDELLLEDYQAPRHRPGPRHRADRPSLADAFRDGIREGWRAAVNVPTSTPAGGITFQRMWRPTS